jgi:hypothetical protein
LRTSAAPSELTVPQFRGEALAFGLGPYRVKATFGVGISFCRGTTRIECPSHCHLHILIISPSQSKYSLLAIISLEWPSAKTASAALRRIGDYVALWLCGSMDKVVDFLYYHERERDGPKLGANFLCSYRICLLLHPL